MKKTLGLLMKGLCVALLCAGPFLLTAANAKGKQLTLSNRLTPVTEENIFRDPVYYNWCSSIIKGEDGKYHLFYSRWEREKKFTAWLTHSKVAHAVADKPEGPYHYVATVLNFCRADHKAGTMIMAHNPKIKYFNGKYYLYFVSTKMGRDISDQELNETARMNNKHANWKVLRENQRTFVATSASLNGTFTIQPEPLLEPSGPITTLVVNPAITQGADGRFYMIVKGDKPGTTKFERNQAMAVSDHPDRGFVLQPDPVINDWDTEDVSMWFDKANHYYYAVFHAHTYIGMMVSENGLNWRKADDFTVMPKRIQRGDGLTDILPDRMERPFVYVEKGEPRVLSLAVKKGDDSYIVTIPLKDSRTAAKHVVPTPTNAQLAWQDAELVTVFHYDLHVFDNKRYDQAYNRITPIPDINIFNPKQLDTDQWIRTAKAMGAKIAILTATHETGFALYQSDVNHYCMKALKYQDGKGDLVRDFVNSCRKYGLRPGIYIGIRWNSYLGVHDFMMPKDGTQFSANRQAYYNRMCEGMTEELMSRYGDLAIVWYDGGGHGPEMGGADILPIVEKYQKNIIFYHNTQRGDIRWGGSESGTVPYPCWGTYPFPYSHSANQEVVFKDNFKLLKEGDPDGKYYKPAMSDAPLRGYDGRHEWFWEPGDELHVFPLNDLISMYEKSVGHNSTLILGITPDARGLVPEIDSTRMHDFGQAIRERFGQPIAQTEETIGKNTVTLSLPAAAVVHDIVLQEDIRYGERVRSYRLEGKFGGKWISLDEGSCIGHKHIIPVANLKLTAVRLKVLSAWDEVHLKRIAVY